MKTRTSKETEYLVVVRYLRSRRTEIINRLKLNWRRLKRRFNHSSGKLIDDGLQELLVMPVSLRVILLGLLSLEESEKATDRWIKYVARVSKLRKHFILMSVSRRLCDDVESP